MKTYLRPVLAGLYLSFHHNCPSGSSRFAYSLVPQYSTQLSMETLQYILVYRCPTSFGSLLNYSFN